MTAVARGLGQSTHREMLQADKVLFGQAQLDLLGGQFVRLDALGVTATSQHVIEQSFALGKGPAQRSQFAR